MLAEIVQYLRNDPVLQGLLPTDPDTGELAVYTEWSPRSRQPYMVVRYTEDTVAGVQGTVADGTLDIHCWDSGASLARLQELAFRVIDILDYQSMEVARGHARFKVDRTGTVPEPEPDVVRWRVQVGTRLLRAAAVQARIDRPTTLQLTNINTASSAQLQELPRIGGSTADAIVQWRTTNGTFAAKEDIRDVPEIGPKTYDAIKGLITV